MTSKSMLFLDLMYFFNSRISKAKSNQSPTWAKFCQLIASLSVVLPQLNLT